MKVSAEVGGAHFLAEDVGCIFTTSLSRTAGSRSPASGRAGPLGSCAGPLLWERGGDT